VTLKIIADRPPVFATIDAGRLAFQPWHPATEVAAIQGLTVGVMPLTDGPWEKGKCSFKMLTYMAVGVPVVASPVGMNVDVLSHGDAGHLVGSLDDWVEALSSILQDESGALAMGRAGRAIVEARYAAKIIGPRLASILVAQAGNT
jgi:hypothetical protein